MSVAGSLIVMGRGGIVPPGAWPYPGRAALPPDPQITASQPPPPEASCWAAEPYDSILHSALIPAGPDRRFHRGNVIGVRVPGLDEGDYAGDRSLDTTWSWTRYSEANMRRCVDWHAIGCSFTHANLSIPQVYNQGKTMDDLVRVMKYAHSKLPFISLNTSSDGLPFSQFQDDVEYLLRKGALLPGRDLLCASWQIDKWFNEVNGIELIIDTGRFAHAHDLLSVVHWGGGYPGWAENCAMWNEETADRWDIGCNPSCSTLASRASFQRVLGVELQVLDGHYGQCWTEAPIDEVQSWISKIVVVFPKSMFFVAAEMDMQAEADDPMHRLELYGDQKAFLAQCAPNHGIQISSMNGSRGRDGRVVLPVAA